MDAVTPDMLPVLAVGMPLALALAAPWLGRAVWPLLALAALVLVAAGLMPGYRAALPELLLGMVLEADPAFAPVLVGSGAVWAAAAFHARGSMTDRPRERVFACLFGLALAGNALLLVAQDMVSFYVGYSIMSLSAWGLIAHKRDRAASMAAKIYLVFAVAGELSLFAAVMLIQAQAQSLLTPYTLSAAPPELAVWLALAAFAVKAGLVPLHMWLPLAHPAAPVPASAALSGAMLKAGIIGALKLAPPALLAPAGTPVLSPDGSVVLEVGTGGIATLGQILLLLGLFGAYAAGIYGALTAERKTVLAYSSVSQLSLALALLGAGYAGYADAALVAAALTVFALHHALAKGALFLSVDSGLPRLWTIGAFLLAALSLTGLPLTTGELSKQGFEAALAASGAPAELAAVFAGAAFATAAVMARGASLPWPVGGPTDVWRGFAVLALASGCILAALPGASLPTLDTLPKALAPGLVLLAGALLFARLRWLRAAAPAGDLLMLAPPLRQSRSPLAGAGQGRDRASGRRGVA